FHLFGSCFLFVGLLHKSDKFRRPASVRMCGRVCGMRLFPLRHGPFGPGCALGLPKALLFSVN
ncbi:hypothetical protein, partial [uncultured Alistipes sp.]|uniref:hypothetical protein n=1 Tax=uncultured Alistipes sp. TaxID=538949 RepID=UPI0025955FC1